jgi:hypothetical protein
VFEFVNTFGPLLYVAFIKEMTYGCKGGCCMDNLSLLLAMIFAVQFLITCYGLVEPIVMKAWREHKEQDSIRQAEAMRESLANDNAGSNSSGGDGLDSDALVRHRQ